MAMAMPGLAVVPPTNVDLVEGTVITTMNARLGSSVVKITAGTSSLVLIVKRIVALKQVILPYSILTINSRGITD